jgi:hypothetical protein
MNALIFLVPEGKSVVEIELMNRYRRCQTSSREFFASLTWNTIADNLDPHLRRSFVGLFITAVDCS